MASAERRRLAGALLLAAIGCALLAYPYLIEAGLARFGVRGACAALLGLGAASYAFGGAARGALGVVAWPGLAIAGALATSLVTGARGPLLWVPAFVYLGVAATFRASLAGEDSLIERCARFIVPETPDFVRSYCRKLTAFWVAFFVLAAGLVAGAALAGDLALWRAFTGWGLYVLMLGISGLEFFVRKTWFRYYFHGGLFDRLWSRWFPAENTEQGRRSAAYIQRYREQAAGDAGARG